MKNLLFRLLFLFLSILTFFISNAQNDKNAYIIEHGDHIYIKLTGKRNLMAHDPISLIKGGKYKDSILIEVPSVQDGTIQGTSIAVKKGYYQYLGNIIIRSNELNVSLLINNTDDKMQEPLRWNGKYRLMKAPH